MQRATGYDWPLDQQSRDMNANDHTGSSSTSSGSPPFSAVSTSPLDVIIGSGSSRVNQDPIYGHLVGGHRRQHSSSRTSNLPESLYSGLGHSTPRNNTFDTRHIHGQHPYAFAAVKHRTPTHDSLAEDRLDDLWSMHGVGGSAHLGLGVTGQLAAANLTGDDWNASPGNNLLSEVLDNSPYFTAAMNSDQLFTVDPSLQRGYDIQNPFGLFGAIEQNSRQEEVDMDAIDSALDIHHEDSPPSEEQEVATGRRSTSADSNVTAAPSHDHDSKLQADADDHDEERDTSTSDHENHDDDKAQKPSTTNNFVRKLHQMISDPKAADFIWWTELGTSFVVSSAGEFSRSILGQHFKHNNFSSFVRQLNMYGFHKINRTPRNQRVQPDAQQWEFSHKKFLRGREDLLDDIKRKPVEPDPSNARQRVELPSEVAAKLRQMSLDHAEVVSALQAERMKVAQLATVVKILFDRVALTSGPLPVHFPHELLDSRPPNLGTRPQILGNAAQASMDLSGDSLVPSQNTNTAASGSRGRQAPVQQTAATRPSKRTRTDPEGGQDLRQPVHKSNSTGSEAFLSAGRQGPPITTWNSSATQNANGVSASRRSAQTRPPDSSQLASQLQVKPEANVFVR